MRNDEGGRGIGLGNLDSSIYTCALALALSLSRQFGRELHMRLRLRFRDWIGLDRIIYPASRGCLTKSKDLQVGGGIVAVGQIWSDGRDRKKVSTM